MLTDTKEICKNKINYESIQTVKSSAFRTHERNILMCCWCKGTREAPELCLIFKKEKVKGQFLWNYCDISGVATCKGDTPFTSFIILLLAADVLRTFGFLVCSRLLSSSGLAAQPSGITTDK